VENTKRLSRGPTGNSTQPLERAVARQSETFTANEYSKEELQEVLSLCLKIIASMAYETCSSDKLSLALFPIQGQIEALPDKEKRTRYQNAFHKIVLLMDSARNKNQMKDFFG
jgi:hypothetical protein